MDAVIFQALTRGEADDLEPAKSIQSARRGDPNAALAILIESQNRFAREPVGAAEMLSLGPSYSINAVRPGADPQRVIGVHHQCHDVNPTAVETRNDVIRRTSRGHAHEPETVVGLREPHPHGSVGGTGQGSDAGKTTSKVELALEI